MTVLGPAGIFLLVTGPTDDDSARSTRVVRPPPRPSSDEVVPALEVPRLEPPPPSLEAMVRSARQEQPAKASSSWPLWLALVVVAAAITAYVAR